MLHHLSFSLPLLSIHIVLPHFSQQTTQEELANVINPYK